LSYMFLLIILFVYYYNSNMFMNKLGIITKSIGMKTTDIADIADTTAPLPTTGH